MVQTSRFSGHFSCCGKKFAYFLPIHQTMAGSAANCGAMSQPYMSDFPSASSGVDSFAHSDIADFFVSYPAIHDVASEKPFTWAGFERM
jgi:hypothetical protein